MENIDIVALQREKDQLRYKAHLRKTEKNWNSYRQIRNKIKGKINERKTLYKKALHLKNSQEIWKTIYCLLNPSTTTSKGNVSGINNILAMLSNLIKRPPRPRRTMLSPPKPILIQLFLYIYDLSNATSDHFCPPNEKDLSNTITTNSYPVKKLVTIHGKQTSSLSHLFFCYFVMVYQD